MAALVQKVTNWNLARLTQARGTDRVKVWPPPAYVVEYVREVVSVVNVEQAPASLVVATQAAPATLYSAEVVREIASIVNVEQVAADAIHVEQVPASLVAVEQVPADHVSALVQIRQVDRVAGAARALAVVSGAVRQSRITGEVRT